VLGFAKQLTGTYVAGFILLCAFSFLCLILLLHRQVCKRLRTLRGSGNPTAGAPPRGSNAAHAMALEIVRAAAKSND